MSTESRPRARTVFETVEERHSEQPTTEPAQPPAVEKPTNPKWQLVKWATNRELDRFVALTGIFSTHIVTGVIIGPVTMLSIKAIGSAVLFSTGSTAVFTWLQAIALTGGIGLVGPLSFVLYRYWSGKN